MPFNRRQFIQGSAAVAASGGMLGTRTSRAFASSHTLTPEQLRAISSPGIPGQDYRSVVTPDGTTLPFKVVDGVKVFHLIAQPVTHEFAPGLVGECWGYNGRVHGPTIEAVEGDRLRIYVTNKLPSPTTIHWHGVFVPNGMDGVPGVTQRAIEPGETFKYEYQLRQHGTFMYHSHHDEMVQMALGLMGMLVVHPRKPVDPQVDRDYVYLLSEWKIEPGTRRPDPNEMTDFNVLTFNGRVFPGTSPIVARQGERVRIRIGNLSATDHHPIHLHGHHFRIVATDGGAIPETARWPETTVLVPVGSTRTVEFVADNPGDWALHCHMTHHTMNQMGHDIPNLIGVNQSEFDEKIASVLPSYLDFAQTGMSETHGEEHLIPPNSIPMFGAPGAFGFINMGGMFTVLKVRENLAEGSEIGWYTHPAGTVADVAPMSDMHRDGIPHEH
jgi:manganese oxidase